MTQRTETAYHEAGHAVAAHALGVAVESASIVEDEESLGRVRAPLPEGFQPDEQRAGSLETLEAHLAVVMAGAAAVEIFAGAGRGELSENDTYGATLLLASLAGTPEQMEAAADAATERAERILRERWAAVEAVAAALTEREELEGEEVARIIEREERA